MYEVNQYNFTFKMQTWNEVIAFVKNQGFNPEIDCQQVENNRWYFVDKSAARNIEVEFKTEYHGNKNNI